MFTPSAGEALLTSLFWIMLALGFNVLIYFWQGERPAMEFLTGYLIEKSLSVDNLFVFILIFNYFKVPLKYQHNLLFWGVLGALVMRAIFILVGVALIARFHFLIYIMGAFLVYTGIKMALSRDSDVDPAQNPVVKFAHKHLRLTDSAVGGKFFVKQTAGSTLHPCCWCSS